MNKIELMKNFMNTFVGNDFHLIIKEGESHFIVDTIEVIQKIDDSCPVKEVPVGDCFLRLWVRDENGREASILCVWSEQLIQNLLDHYVFAKEAGCKEIMMLRNPNDPENWILVWGNGLEKSVRKISQTSHPQAYIS